MGDDVREFLKLRRAQTEERFRSIQERMKGAASIVDDFATVYATGSFGRGEASPHSDLDVFILTQLDGSSLPALHPSSTIRLQAFLIDAVEKEDLPEFTDQGAYLKPHTLTDMTEKLGGRDDDYENLFTARMLLLLESRALLGDAAYIRAIDFVLDEYWKDYPDNAADFRPIFLTNDIIRYWKVLCLNYEANTRKSENPSKRALHNYKLKHSRLLTCYSAILYFCHLLRNQASISKDDAIKLTKLSPTERLLTIADEGGAISREIVQAILSLYVEFLKETDAPKSELLERFGNPEYRRKRHQAGIEFGDRVFSLLEEIGAKTPLFRYLMV